MLEGGRHTNLQRSFQQPGKSTDPLVFTPVEKGASFHTFCAKPQWRKRWVIDSGVLHLLPLMVEVMFRVAKHSPTGNAPRKIFHNNSLSFRAVWIFHTPAFQSKVSSSWSIASSSVFSKAALYPVFVVYSPDRVPNQMSLSGVLFD